MTRYFCKMWTMRFLSRTHNSESWRDCAQIKKKKKTLQVDTKHRQSPSFSILGFSSHFLGISSSQIAVHSLTFILFVFSMGSYTSFPLWSPFCICCYSYFPPFTAGWNRWFCSSSLVPNSLVNSSSKLTRLFFSFALPLLRTLEVSTVAKILSSSAAL